MLFSDVSTDSAIELNLDDYRPMVNIRKDLVIAVSFQLFNIT